jgi:DNA-binding transcriptional LysR family regulator
VERSRQALRLVRDGGTALVRTPAISTHTRLTEALFIEHGVEPPAHQIEADDESVLVNLVSAGVGVSLMRDDVARGQAKAGAICIWPKARLRTMLWFVGAAQRAEEPLIDALLGLVCERARPEPARAGSRALTCRHKPAVILDVNVNGS